MSKQLGSLLGRTEKSISEAVDYQERNNSGLNEYNAFLVHQLLKSISETLAELEGEKTADEYFIHFREHEEQLRSEQ
jgi:hypothetical protein